MGVGGFWGLEFRDLGGLGFMGIHESLGFRGLGL